MNIIMYVKTPNFESEHKIVTKEQLQDEIGAMSRKLMLWGEANMTPPDYVHMFVSKDGKEFMDITFKKLEEFAKIAAIDNIATTRDITNLILKSI